MNTDKLNIIFGRAGKLVRTVRDSARSNLLYSRSFSSKTSKRLLLLTLKERIPQSQINPFHYFANQIREKRDTEIREISVSKFLAKETPGLDNATTVCFQTEFSVPHGDLMHLIEEIRRRNPIAKIVYLDWFAPTDLRLAETLNPHIDIYVKKHVLRDRSQYGKPTLGDTNLTDYFCRYYDIPRQEVVFAVPDSFWDKLLIGPSFATADFMLSTFMADRPLGDDVKQFDVHARLGFKGDDWYQTMREDCLDAVAQLPNLVNLTEFGVGMIRYLYELKSSKICFSPFGYGEVCWRDYEAVANGAVLLKPDMSHIETAPDIFKPMETYVPLKWDLSDYAEKTQTLIDNPALRNTLTKQAFSVLGDYMKQGHFVDQMAPIFD